MSALALNALTGGFVLVVVAAALDVLLGHRLRGVARLPLRLNHDHRLIRLLILVAALYIFARAAFTAGGAS